MDCAWRNYYVNYFNIFITYLRRCGRLGQFWWKTWKVFGTKHIGDNDTMACETHGIHSTLHNGDGSPPRQRVDRKREIRHRIRIFCLGVDMCH